MNKNSKQIKKHESEFEIDLDDSLEPISLRFSPTAWAKLLFFRDYGETEIGGFCYHADG